MRNRWSLSVCLIASGLAACGPSVSEPNVQDTSCGLASDQIGKFLDIPGGEFVKGADAFYREELPTKTLQVEAFRLQIHEVTNAQFEAFVEETGYETDAEKGVREDRLGAGSALFTHPDLENQSGGVWTLDATATWRTPEGAGSDLTGRAHEPVVHVSQQDAAAYAAWAGGRLPTEVEWEYAASLGLPDPDEPASGAYQGEATRANTWQGIFPMMDSGRDGFTGRASVGCFDADRIGLYDMIGNVWEWTDTPYAPGNYTIKGGSFLCADNFCRRYRPAARQPQEADFSTNHIGFRIVHDVEATTDASADPT